MAVDITKLITKAHEAIERRNYDLAIYSYKHALALQPENIDARIKLRAAQNRAFSESGTNQYVGILKALIPLIKAQIFSIANKNEQALVACEEALTANPTMVFTLKLLATITAKMEMFEVACWQSNELINKYDPENISIMYDLIEWLPEIGRNKEAIELCEKIKEFNPDEDIDGIIRELAANQTATVFEKGATEGARTILKDNDETMDLEIESQIARTDEMRQRKAEALEKKLAERPDDYRLLLRIGDTWFDFEDFTIGAKKATEAYEKARALMPSDHNIIAKIGDIEIKKKRINILALKKKFKADKDPEIKKKYVAAYKDLMQYQIKEYERRIKDQPLISSYHFTLGGFYLESKLFDKAVAEFQQSCKDPKYSLVSYTKMGQAFVGMDQIDLGIDMFTKALKGQEVFSKIRDTVYFLGCALEKSGENKEALKQFTRIFEEDITYKDIKDKVTSLRTIIKQQNGAA